MIQASGLEKSFLLHLQGGVRIDVLHAASLHVAAGECLALSGPSGAGKSTLLRALYANYLIDAGSIRVRHHGVMTELAGSSPHDILAIRRDTIGYVSQFLRAMPRVAARDIVAEPLLARGIAPAEAVDHASALLRRLGIPAPLHDLPPATFSGGEQQRVNLARSFAAPWPILLLDEPTASLDAANRDIVIGLIGEAKRAGSAVVGIFHDLDVRDRVADRVMTVEKVPHPEIA